MCPFRNKSELKIVMYAHCNTTVPFMSCIEDRRGRRYLEQTWKQGNQCASSSSHHEQHSAYYSRTILLPACYCRGNERKQNGGGHERRKSGAESEWKMEEYSVCLVAKCDRPVLHLWLLKLPAVVTWPALPLSSTLWASTAGVSTMLGPLYLTPLSRTHTGQLCWSFPQLPAAPIPPPVSHCDPNPECTQLSAASAQGLLNRGYKVNASLLPN